MKPIPSKPNKRKPSMAWRKKYDCKPNKGNHNWVIVSIKNNMEGTRQEKYGVSYGAVNKVHPTEHWDEVYAFSIVNWECGTCKKKDMECYDN